MNLGLEGYGSWLPRMEAALRLCSGAGALPDLVLVDLMLPRLGGHRRHSASSGCAIKTCRSSCCQPRIKADKVLALSIGADDYITKPPSAWPSFWPGARRSAAR